MKTAISIPDHVFEAAERLAKQLGVSRSQLYANAVAQFIDRNQRYRVTEKLDELYGSEPDLSELDPVISTLQSNALRKEDW